MTVMATGASRRVLAVLGLVIGLAAGGAVTGCSSDSDSTAPAVGATLPALSGRGGTVYSVGFNDAEQLGRSTSAVTDVNTATVRTGSGQQLTAVVALAAGDQHSVAVRSDGTVYSWGINDRGQLGTGTTTPSGRPVPVRAADGRAGQLTDVVQVAADSNFTMALRRDGTVVAWGTNDAGQRGIGDATAPLYPTSVLDSTGRRPLRDIVAVSVDGRTEMALRRDGLVLSWGANADGMLGDGTLRRRSLPGIVRGIGGTGSLTRVRGLAVGGQFAVAVLDDGQVVAWGANRNGQLGDGTRRPHRFPAYVQDAGAGRLTGIVAVAAAEQHAYALRGDGTGLAWGLNSAGQLGDGSTTSASKPVVIVGLGGAPALRGIRTLIAGEAYGVALLDRGLAVTWGANGKGQLSAGPKGEHNRLRPGPVVLPGSASGRVVAAGAGRRHLLLAVDNRSARR